MQTMQEILKQGAAQQDMSYSTLEEQSAGVQGSSQ